MRATRIKMRPGCYNSDSLLEIDQVFIVGWKEAGYINQPDGYYHKEDLHDFLKRCPNTIQVDLYPFPECIPEVSIRGEKYIRSTPNSSTKDNLLSLPRD
jgi:hypothetical protein